MSKNIYTSNIIRTGFMFEDLCAEVFQKRGIKVEQDVAGVINGLKYEVDLILTDLNKCKFIVEVKFYRSTKPTKTMLKKSIERIKNIGKSIGIENYILLIGMPVKNKLREEIENEYSVYVMDSDDLFYLIDGDEELNKKYVSLMNDVLVDINEYESKEIKLDYLAYEEHEIIVNNNVGEILKDEIKNIKPGKAEFVNYENKCTEILMYLFEKNLATWSKQCSSDDDINRYDLICTAKRGNEFWELLIDEFHSRYIVFEFKNYSDKVKQTQVYTTEKYLFQKALRNVSFIVSRKGLDEYAIRATKGILRENGKLIISLNDKDLMNMIDMKENGDEPSDYLLDLVDNILLKLGK
ncbi:hypothetical protein FDF15_06045 [Clostridium botulinum]|uniref:restriction endonuclease n=1 Tax=Clostridium botulinum TaxID=1491 RepID=UPI00077303FE|nr:restriction endonuclease [Clostridium botulinum]APH25027.1 restriction endonuclease family protein [Clostridium botulinum]APQ67882.1 restriction endonuclease family protein [Clostridium botulinum]MBN3377402.1 hypothetical protein [Clostridium botulinum]MBN3404502.1 hypothetical protein [Clostridium botulinum]MBY6996882.1 restriction endonuclease [Clostridium botulinum]